ncbi:MAG: hypothetical protein R2734_04115 [Nocardioides sp.]
MRLPAAGLTRRLVLAMGGVVLLSSLLTVLLTTPLLRSTTQSAARESMQRQLTLLARLPTAALSSPRAAQVAARGELQLGVLSPSGTPTGSATLLSRAERRRLLAGGSVSASSGSGSDRVLVEARPTRDGGAVVLVSSDQVVNAAMVRMRRRVLAATSGLVLASGRRGAGELAPSAAPDRGWPRRRGGWLAESATCALLGEAARDRRSRRGARSPRRRAAHQ